MGKKIRIRVRKPWIAYPGSTLQQNYSEAQEHGYLLWDVKGKRDWDVSFCALSNPRPFITLEWQGSVAATVGSAAEYPRGSRFRIKSAKHIVQEDVSALTSELHKKFSASEVTFRYDQKQGSEVLSAGTTELIREDLRNPEVLMGLLKDYYHNVVVVSDDEWQEVHGLLCQYASNIKSDAVNRGSKWSLRHLKFDNVFNYGRSNVIDFEKLNGIVGIFGPNRSGKSSIVGTIMYSVFNTSDRGSVKNKDICNTRKPYCYSRSVVRSGGKDYVIERQTAKQETKQGEIYAPTSLNLFRMDGDEAVDLAGEQRNDTEKVIRQMLGSASDFMLTSLSAQGDADSYIKHGSSQRRLALSRFLDLDVCWQIHEQAKNDVNLEKASLRVLPERDWDLLMADCKDSIVTCDANLVSLNLRMRELRNELGNVKTKLTGLSGREPVTEAQITDQQHRVDHLLKQVEAKQAQLDSEVADILDLEEKLGRVETVLKEHDLDSLKKQYAAYQQLKSSVRGLKTVYDKEDELLQRQQRSLKILDEVPCGDRFPSCKFIKDAHDTLLVVDEQSARVIDAKTNWQKASRALSDFSIDTVLGTIDKLEQLVQLRSKTKLRISELTTSTVRLGAETADVLESLEESRARLLEFKEAQDNEENSAAVRLRKEMNLIEQTLNETNADMVSEASRKGRYESQLETLQREQEAREQALQRMKIHEIVCNGFSKKGIPNLIVGSQLPVINAEIAKILSGITNYTVEMEREGDNDRIEIYINYGDSRRPIELASGMEKFIASIAMRVAMINVSTLPKSDMFIIDEGFGSLDDLSVEACNRLLVSLKRYFRVIIVITHVDAIKDSADHVIEITRTEKDAKVVYT